MRLAGILKPEYFYQPKLAIGRLLPWRSRSVRAAQSSPTGEFVDEQLPWGMPIRIRPVEEHGRILLTLGVIDLAVTETLWRLTEPGELAVDVGANIGYMTAVLAARVGSMPGGCVRAFEAHPEIFEELKYNTLRWQKQLTGVKIDIQQVAISDKRGTVKLVIPDAFSSNRGLAYASKSDEELNHLKSVIVEAVTLDELFTQREKIGVFKLDVEGHEFQVLEGANSLLKEQRVRDCVFEEHGEYPTAVTRYFEEMGYSVFRIQRQFFKPVLLAPNSKVARTKWLPTSFLATQQPERALSRIKEPGWQCLKGQ